mmetsp:Transcript_17165/g.28177  ORF Transcript_17165/g.28177 Transcript_17165/m.28177 type:complete len:305 (+) Transcript_17165:97-1011(+)
MVEISEVMEEEVVETTTTNNNDNNNAVAVEVESRSQERLADADEIEAALLAHITRPSAQMHLKNLITKLRKEGKALQRVAASTNNSATATAATTAGSNDSAPVATTKQPAALSTPIVTKPIIITSSTTNKYQTFPTHYFDCGPYNSPLVTIYTPLPDIGTHDKSKISCHFTSTSFDLIVTDFSNKSYRLLNDNLEKEIDVTKSKYVIKPHKIIIKLGKVKGEYGSYDHWTELTSKKKKTKDTKSKDDPTAGIMDLMKDMYENGDDNMKKMIGETMYKQRTGQLGKDGGGGLPGMGDMGLGDMDF